MPSKNTTIKHLTGTLSRSGVAKALGPLSDSQLHKVLDTRSREIYDNSDGKRRDERRSLRLKKQHELHKKKSKLRPKPLSAKERKKLCLDEIPEEERKWALYEPLRALWRGYAREILGIKDVASAAAAAAGGKGKGKGEAPTVGTYVTPLGAGPVLASADLHGAVVECVRSRCVSRVGVKGVVVQDRKFVFVVITERNQMKMLPKEHSIFRFSVPISEDEKSEQKDLVFEIHGEQFQNRAPDRAKKQFKHHYNPDL